MIFTEAMAAPTIMAPRVSTVCFVILPFSSLIYEEIVFFISGILLAIIAYSNSKSLFLIVFSKPFEKNFPVFSKKLFKKE